MFYQRIFSLGYQFVRITYVRMWYNYVFLSRAAQQKTIFTILKDVAYIPQAVTW